ncbi:MAG: M16 family metallopeptidase [Gemmatimonadales bacterium]
MTHPTPVIVQRVVGDIDILAARFGDVDQTALALYRVRDDSEDSGNAGLAALGIRAMLRGTEELDATALAFAIETMGGTLSPVLSADLLGLAATVLTPHAAAATALLLDVLERPRLAPDLVAIERGLLADDARSVADDMFRFPMQLALGVAYGDVGYGSPLLGTPESIATFDADTVRAWHARTLAARITLVAVGNGDAGRMADELADVVRLRRGREVATGTMPPVGVTASAAIVPGIRVAHRDRKQSALAMVFPGPSRRSPERFAAEVWGAIAAGLGGRLFESLRSARSLAYSVVATSWQRRRTGALITYIATDPARLDEAREAMLEELATFRHEPPSAEEVLRATAMLAGHAEIARQSAGALAGEIAGAWLLGQGLGELEDPAAPYRVVDRAAVHAASQLLDPASRAEGVVEPG